MQEYTITGDATIATSSLSNGDVTRLWHLCLRNISKNGMIELSSKGLLNGQNISKLKFCEHCIFGKHRRVKFTKGIHNTKETLDYIYFELWGPFRVPLKEGASYVLTIIDDFSKKVWIFFLKKKMMC